MPTRVVSATIEEVLAEKLEKIATETNRKKSYFVNQALKEYFEQLEDYEIALERKHGPSTSLKQAERDLGL